MIRLRPAKPLVLILVALALPLGVMAETLRGNVLNVTTGKPQPGAEVVLLKLSEGMQEVARARADSKGDFSINVADAAASHLLRVTHQGVNYHRPAPAGTTSVEVQVFDSAPNVEGVSASVNVVRAQANANTLQITEMYGVNNNSSPPRTQMSERAFEVHLPEGAVLQDAMAAGPGGMPVKSAPVPGSEPNRYAFVFPLRPGETRFQVSYTLPYDGKTKTFEHRLFYPYENVAVMLPKSMQFSSSAVPFRPTGEDPSVSILLANAVPATSMSFTFSGTGEFPPDPQEAAQTPGEQPRPGGGLGPPSQQPNPLQKYQWWIFGGIAAALAIGAVVIASRKPAGVPAPDRPVTSAAATIGHEPALLDLVKDELFALETDRAEGRLSDQEYAQQKQALDVVLQRALRRRRS